MSPPPNPAYHLRARLPSSLAPKGLERALCRYVTEMLELTFPSSEVVAQLAEGGPPAVTLAGNEVPPHAVRQAFVSALEVWRRVVPTDGPEWDTSRMAEIIDQLPQPRRRRAGRSGTGTGRRRANGGEP